MKEIMQPFPFMDFDFRPPLSGRVKISDDLQQGLSSIVGWDGNSRRLIKCNPQGVLSSVSPVLRGIINVLGSGINDTWQGSDTEISEVMIMAHPDNTGRIWVNHNDTAAVNTGIPLDKGDSISLSICNLLHLHLLIVVDAERVIIAYTE